MLSFTVRMTFDPADREEVEEILVPSDSSLTQGSPVASAISPIL